MHHFILKNGFELTLSTSKLFPTWHNVCLLDRDRREIAFHLSDIPTIQALLREALKVPKPKEAQSGRS